MTPRRKQALLRGVFAFVIFCTFFTIVAALFIDREPITLGPFVCSRQVVAAMAIYAHGFIVAWIEYRRGLKEQGATTEPSRNDHG